jgi:hypothetical protein
MNASVINRIEKKTGVTNIVGLLAVRNTEKQYLPHFGLGCMVTAGWEWLFMMKNGLM